MKLYRISEVAKMFGLSRFTIWQWVKKGKIRAIRPGGNWLIPESEVKRVFKVDEFEE